MQEPASVERCPVRTCTNFRGVRVVLREIFMNRAMETMQSSPAETPSPQRAPGRTQRTSGPRRMEHRWGERMPVRATVRVHCAKWDAAGQIRDASLSGAFVHTRLQVAAWTHVEVELSRRSDCSIRRARCNRWPGNRVERVRTAPGPGSARALNQRSTERRERSASAGGRIAKVSLTAGRLIIRPYHSMTRGLSRSLTMSA